MIVVLQEAVPDHSLPQALATAAPEAERALSRYV